MLLVILQQVHVSKFVPDFLKKMDDVHRNQGVNGKFRKQNLQYQGTSAPGINQEPMLTLGCPISKNHNPTNQSQSSEDKGKHVDSVDDHLTDIERVSLKREPVRHLNFTESSSSTSDGITIVRLNRDEGNHSMDNMLDGEENETMPIIESAQRSVKQKLDGTNVPEGFQVEMASTNEVQIYQDVLSNENSSNTRDSPRQEHASVITPSGEFKGWMEGIMKIGSASQFHWPKWTVSYLLDSSGMENLITYYRILNLANDLNNEDLRLFLEEQLRKETAGLSKDSIRRRLWTRIHGSSTALTELGAIGENSDTCSICMAEFKDSDRIASLYYCPHEYHVDCISEWLLKSNACPLCRALAIIPEQYPDWNGDIHLHRAFFMKKIG